MNETAVIIETTLPATGDELQARLRALREWKKNAIDEVQMAKDAMNADNYRKEKLNAFDWLDKRVKECADEIARVAMPDMAKAMLVELTATRAEVKAAVEERKDALRALKDANDPKPEEFEYIVEIRCTQKTAEAWFKKFDRDGLAYRARRVKDGESAKVGKMFDDGKEAGK